MQEKSFLNSNSSQQNTQVEKSDKETIPPNIEVDPSSNYPHPNPQVETCDEAIVPPNNDENVNPTLSTVPRVQEPSPAMSDARTPDRITEQENLQGSWTPSTPLQPPRKRVFRKALSFSPEEAAPLAEDEIQPAPLAEDQIQPAPLVADQIQPVPVLDRHILQNRLQNNNPDGQQLIPIQEENDGQNNAINNGIDENRAVIQNRGL